MGNTNGNGLWQKLVIALVMLILGTLVASGYMSCQYNSLAQDFDEHVAVKRVEDLEMAKTMGRIEEWMKSIDQKLEKLEEK